VNRDEQILSIAKRKMRQGISIDQQYATLNRARDKRKRRRARNLKLLLSGGNAHVPLIGVRE